MPSKGTAAEGYGYAHRKLRRQLEPDVAAGRARCWRCGQRIEPGEPWDLGHANEPGVSGHRRRHAGPEHRRCNRATMGRERATVNSSAEATHRPPDVDTSRLW